MGNTIGNICCCECLYKNDYANRTYINQQRNQQHQWPKNNGHHHHHHNHRYKTNINHHHKSAGRHHKGYDNQGVMLEEPMSVMSTSSRGGAGGRGGGRREQGLTEMSPPRVHRAKRKHYGHTNKTSSRPTDAQSRNKFFGSSQELHKINSGYTNTALMIDTDDDEEYEESYDKQRKLYKRKYGEAVKRILSVDRTYSVATNVTKVDNSNTGMMQMVEVQVQVGPNTWSVTRRISQFVDLEEDLRRETGWSSPTLMLQHGNGKINVATCNKYLQHVAAQNHLAESFALQRFLELDRIISSTESESTSVVSTSTGSGSNTVNSSDSGDKNITLLASVTQSGTNITINVDDKHAQHKNLDSSFPIERIQTNGSKTTKAAALPNNLLAVPEYNPQPPESPAPPPYSSFLKPSDEGCPTSEHKSFTVENSAEETIPRVPERRRRQSSINIRNPDGPALELSPADFHFITVIGKGSFGQVLLAKHLATNKHYAVKMLSKRMIIRRQETEHILSERSVLIKVLNHPYLVQLHYAFTTHHKIFLVLDYVNGGELFFHLQRERAFSEPRAMFYCAEMLCAMTYMHTKGIVYRDLKPENILLDKEGHIVLTDFGLCKEGLKTSTAKTGTFCGTPEYLAPEILLKKSYTRVIDWWTLGAVLYEMLYGLPPFYSKNQSTMYESILKKPLKLKQTTTSRARNLLTALLKKTPEERLGAGPEDGEAIKKHEFFRTIDWEMVENRKMTPPFVPKVNGEADTRNIDPSFKRESIMLGSVSGASTSTGAALPSVHTEQIFKGFDYARPNHNRGDDDSPER